MPTSHDEQPPPSPPAKRPPIAFHTKYLAVCRQRNAQPLAAIGKGDNQRRPVLDFHADRVRLDQWLDILRALPHDQQLQRIGIRLRKPATRGVLQQHNSERKCRALRHDPVLITKFLFGRVIAVLGQLLPGHRELTTLALEGLPLADEYAELLATELGANRSLRSVSFARSPIGDAGCRALCRALRSMATVDRLDFSECGLSCAGAEHIAGMLGYQKIQRFSEAWQESLRYRSVDPDQMAGLKYVGLNGNPGVGDAGLRALLVVLAEDVWIKGVQMRHCGLSEVGAEELLQCLRENKTLVVFDVRGNEAIGEVMMNRVRKQFVVETDEVGKRQAEAPAEKAMTLRQEEERLVERIGYLEQQLRIEAMVRRQAEELNGQLQSQLQFNEQQRAAEEMVHPQGASAGAEVPEGFVLVPTKQLSSLFLEVEEIRGTASTLSHSTSLLTQISNPKFSNKASPELRQPDTATSGLRKAKSELVTALNQPRPGPAGSVVHFSKQSQSECRIRCSDSTSRRPNTPRFVERNMGDFLGNGCSTKPFQVTEKLQVAKALPIQPSSFFASNEDEFGENSDDSSCDED